MDSNWTDWGSEVGTVNNGYSIQFTRNNTFNICFLNHFTVANYKGCKEFVCPINFFYEFIVAIKITHKYDSNYIYVVNIFLLEYNQGPFSTNRKK